MSWLSCDDFPMYVVYPFNMKSFYIILLLNLRGVFLVGFSTCTLSLLWFPVRVSRLQKYFTTFLFSTFHPSEGIIHCAHLLLSDFKFSLTRLFASIHGLAWVFFPVLLWLLFSNDLILCVLNAVSWWSFIASVTFLLILWLYFLNYEMYTSGEPLLCFAPNF